MFMCQMCRAHSKPKQKQEEVVTKIREKEYPRRTKANVGYKDKRGHRVRSKSNSDRTDDPGGKGWEIAECKTVIGCDECTGKGGPCPGKLA